MIRHFSICMQGLLAFALLQIIPQTILGQSFDQGVVVCVSQPSADAGAMILKKGGNAVDAAIATQFALAVTHPAAGNIGGGGFMVVHTGKIGDIPAIFEYREAAPRAAHETVYKKDDGVFTHKASGVPGSVRGMAIAHQRFGTLAWKELLAPAVQLASEGFAVSRELAASLNYIRNGSKNFAELQRVFTPPNGKSSWSTGDILRQEDLGKTLQRIAEHGPDEFYQGETARLIAQEMKTGSGLITLEDLARYQARERKAIELTYRGYKIYGAPTPSSGVTTLGIMLNILENRNLATMGRYKTDTMHLLIESMKRAFAERARHLGDQGFTDIPSKLLDKAFAKELMGNIPLDRSTPSAELTPEISISKESENTTHFSVVDKNGMAVSNTTTLEQSYGSKVVVKGAGFLLNNEMADFNWFPGETNSTGRIGTKPNLIQPGKKMLSSMTPVIVTRDGKPFLVTGSPGSRTIINTVLQIIINVIDFDMPIQLAVDSPRLHHQWFPDVAKFEATNDASHAKTISELRNRGHAISQARQGDAHSILIDPKSGKRTAGVDRRIEGGVSGY